MALLSDVAKVTVKDDTQVATKARALWAAMRDEAVNVRHLPVIVNRYGEGYILIGSVATYMRRLWPKDGRGKTDTIRKFLRASGNVVVLEAGTNSATKRPENRIFVRVAWREAVAIPVGGGVGAVGSNQVNLSRKEQRLTPHEAGEDREPGPVTIRRAPKPRSHKSRVPVTVELAGGRVQCGACGQDFPNRASLGSHKRKHYHERQKAGLEPLAERSEPVSTEPASTPAAAPKPAPPVDADIQRAIDALQQYPRIKREVQNLRSIVVDLEDEVRRLTAENRDLLGRIGRGEDLPTKQSDAEQVVLLITDALNKFNNAEVGPVRTLMDIQDALTS